MSRLFDLIYLVCGLVLLIIGFDDWQIGAGLSLLALYLKDHEQ